MSSISHYWKTITPQSANMSVTNSQDIGGNRGLYGHYSWYNRIIQGSATRLIRYREYDVMDNDIDVARALDIMAEEMSGNSPKTRLPLEVLIETGSEQIIPNHVVATIQASLKTWCKIHGWQDRIFGLCRNLIKYGDVFMERHENKNKPFRYIHPKHVIGAIVSEHDITEVRGWSIRQGYKKPSHYWQGDYGAAGASTTSNLHDQNIKVLDKDDIVRFSVSNDMSEEAPFGCSVLRPVYRTFKQKELLEDAILIYRISRAPEKRVFYIDVGDRPPHLVNRQLEMFRNEIKQKKIPSRFSGKNQVESIYNPQSMNEDFYFAVRPDGKGSRVETLPGGQGLGELTELDYFFRKMWRALRIPPSYMGSTTEEGQAIQNESRVGVAYMQEIKFTQFISRLQHYVEVELDKEFKRWLYDSNIHIDPTLYRIVLPDPSDYWKSRQQTMDADYLNNFTSAEGVQYLSKRFALERYLGLTKAEIKINERMLREERGLDPNGDDRDLAVLYFPENAEAAGLDGGLGGGVTTPPGIGGPPGPEDDEDIDVDTPDEETPDEPPETPGEEAPGGGEAERPGEPPA